MNTRAFRRLALASAALLLLTACGSSPTPTPVPSPAATSIVLNLRAVLAASDIAVGRNRLLFALLNPASAPIQASAVNMTLSYVQNNAAVPQGTLQAQYRPWPGGQGGVFAAQIDFPQAGTWLAELTPVDGQYAGELARMVIKVADTSVTPAINSPAPSTVNRTAKDVASLDELTSDKKPDPDLYTMTIANAEKSGKPTVIVFATPAFCQSATCGPQVDELKLVKNAYKGKANFIHIEIYANPKEMLGDPSKGVVADAVNQWNLPSEPWTFILDAQGKVSAKFEGFTGHDEIEAALKPVL